MWMMCAKCSALPNISMNRVESLIATVLFLNCNSGMTALRLFRGTFSRLDRFYDHAEIRLPGVVPDVSE
jgi:hypothetical protein